MYDDFITCFSHRARVFLPWIASWLNHSWVVTLPEFRALFGHRVTSGAIGFMCMPPDLWLRVPVLVGSAPPMVNGVQARLSIADTQALDALCAANSFTPDKVGAQRLLEQWRMPEGVVGDGGASWGQRPPLAPYTGSIELDERRLSFRECAYKVLMHVHTKATAEGV
jgi:hypothetical protein